MSRLTVVVALVLVGVLAGAAMAQQVPAPAPQPGQAGPGAGGGRMGQGMDPVQMVDMMAERLGLTEPEKAATKKALAAKMEAQRALGPELEALRQVARNPQATDKELAAALQKYDAALQAYRKKTAAIDTALGKAISLKARAGLTAVGMIDNGMGMGMGRRQRSGAGGGAPGAGGGAGGMFRPQGGQ